MGGQPSNEISGITAHSAAEEENRQDAALPLYLSPGNHPGRSCVLTEFQQPSLFLFLGPHLWHIEVPRLGFELELQLLACTTATATQDPSRFCDLHTPQFMAMPDP